MVQKLPSGVCCHHVILQEPFTNLSIDAEYRVPSSHESREISMACSMRLQATHCWQPQYHCYWCFLSLSCIDDKQVAPSNDMSLDRSPMHLGERRMGVQVEN